MRTHSSALALGLLGLCVGFGACRSSEPTDVEVEVRSVAMDHASGSPVVVLQDKDHRVALPIWIGPSEAQAIALQIQGIQPPRPMTHDLMKNVLDEAGIELDSVVIGGLKESTYYARLHLHNGNHGMEIDSRPSDAIALAVRFKKPIFVARGLMQGDTTIDLRRIEGPNTVRARGVTVQALSAELAEYFDVRPGTGVLVTGVREGTSGLRTGDVILTINGGPVEGLTDFAGKLGALGDAAAQLEVQRGSERVQIALDEAGGAE